MKEDLNIEELFKSKFEGFEGQVDPSAWANISQSIGAGAAGGAGGATGAGLSTFAKVAIVAGITAVTSVGVWYLSQDGDEPVSNENPVVAENVDNTNPDQSNDITPLEIEDNELIGDVNNVLEEEGDNGIQEENIDEVVSNENQNDLNEVVNNNHSQNTNNTNSNNTQTNNNSSNNNNEHTDNNSSDSNQGVNTDPQTVDVDVIIPMKADPSVKQDGNKIDCLGNAENHKYVKWNFGDGEIATGDIVSHVYAKPGNYTVTASIGGDSNALVETFEITIEGTSAITKVPNTLTPNGDNRNDFFFIEYEGLTEFSIVIYDPQGRSVVFSSNDPNFVWDGNLPDGTVESGKYPFMINAVGEDGQTFQRAGSITLTR